MLLVWPIYQRYLVIYNNVCVGFDFMDGDIMVGYFLTYLLFGL